MVLPRRAEAVVAEALGDFRIVLINGARQSGKTTLVRRLQTQRGGTFVTLEDPTVLGAVSDDPRGLVGAFAEPLMIDEFQKGGDRLLSAIKLAVDEDRRPGRFVLTGSTRFLTVPTLSESLAGRVRIVDLWPFSQREIRRTVDGFVDRAFADPDALRGANSSTMDRAGYLEVACAGGFPEAVRLGPRARSRWFEDYVRTVTQRDVAEISRVRQIVELPRLLRLLSALTAQELNVAGLARSAGMDDQTVRNYLPLLETVYLVHRVPAWSRNLTAKVKRHPKVHMTDSGLAAHLMGVSPMGLARPGVAAAGALLETFVVNEIAKQLTWSETPARLAHFRDRNGPEVDVVLETGDGRVVGIEVKASMSAQRPDFAGLRLLRDRLGDGFVHGFLLYTGEQTLSFGERVTAAPISALWGT